MCVYILYNRASLENLQYHGKTWEDHDFTFQSMLEASIFAERFLKDRYEVPGAWVKSTTSKTEDVSILLVGGDMWWLEHDWMVYFP